MATRPQILFISIAASFLLVITPTRAQQQPTGAFGLSFGQVLDPSKLRRSSYELFYGEPTYAFTPQYPSNFFDIYLVQVSQLTNRVYSIWAFGKAFRDELECGTQARSVSHILQDKYGAALERLRDKPQLEQRHRHAYLVGTVGVSVSCYVENYASYRLVIAYMDVPLLNQAERERREHGTRRTDKRGF